MGPFETHATDARRVTPEGAILADLTGFAELERDGWSDPARAAGYVGLFASASDQAIASLLDAAGAKAGLNALDLCCGQGNVAEALLERGCRITGIDFSPAMLAFARRRVAGATFTQGDAQTLPFDDGEFDIVVSNLGVCHVPDQPRALSEVRRVLRPGGRFAMTVWCGPDRSPCFDLVYRTIKTHGSPTVSVPPGPDFHQFAKREAAESLLHDAGLQLVDWAVVDCAWDLERPEGLAEIYEKGTVRAATMLNSQPPQHLAAIRAALAQAVRERFAHGERWRVPVPAALLSASA